MVPLHSPPPSSPPSPRVRSPPSPYIGHETDGSRIYIYIYNISVNINITRRVNYKKISRGYIRWWTCDGKISLLQSLSHPPSPPSSRSAREPCRGRGSPLENPVCAPFRFCPRSLCVPGHTIALNILCRAHFGGTFYRLRLKDGWLSRELT